MRWRHAADQSSDDLEFAVTLKDFRVRTRDRRTIDAQRDITAPADSNWRMFDTNDLDGASQIGASL